MSEGWLSKARSLIPITESKIYFDNAGAGPLSKPVLDAINRFTSIWAEHGEPWDEVLEHIVEARRLFSYMIGVGLEEVAAVPGVTYGFNALLASIRFPPGSNVVAGPYNFPTTYYSLHALRRRGLVREVRIAQGNGAGASIDEWERVIDDKTVLVVADHVSWITGYREDLKALAEITHRHGAILVTDAFHSVGVIPVDVGSLGVDVLLTGSYKWLMGPHGAGFTYVSRELIGELDPLLSGWMAIEDSVVARMERGENLFERPFETGRLEPARDARILEWGTWPAIAFEGLLASMKMLQEYRAPERYSSHTEKLVNRLMDGIEALGFELITPRDRKAGIVVFRHRNPYELAGKLAKYSIIVSPRPGKIRISPHYYNTREEVEAFLEALGKAVR